MATREPAGHPDQRPRHSPLRWKTARNCWYARLPGKKAATFFYGSHKDALAKYHAKASLHLNGHSAVPVSPSPVPVVPPVQTPVKAASGITVEEIYRQYRDHRLQKVEEGKLKFSSHRESEKGTKAFADFHPGPAAALTRNDFAKYRKQLFSHYKSPEARARYINAIKKMFRWAGPGDNNAELIPSVPKYGGEFDAPTKNEKAEHRELVRQEEGEQYWEAADIKQLLKAADVLWKPLVLLGINCGLRNEDFGALTLKHIDLKTGLLDYPRRKTRSTIPRQSILWPRTVKAIKKWLAVCPKAAESKYENLLFLTETGLPLWRDGFVKVDGELKRDKYDWFAHPFAELRKKAGVTQKLGFKALRSSCRTFGAQVGDKEAIDLVMGHSPKGVGATVYTGKINGYWASRERLVKVAEIIHQQVFGKPSGLLVSPTKSSASAEKRWYDD